SISVIGPGEAAAAAHAPGGPNLPSPPQLISSVDPKFLTLTKVDAEIYGEFRRVFGGLRVDVLDPEELKSEAAKEVGDGGGLKGGVIRGFNMGVHWVLKGGFTPVGGGSLPRSRLLMAGLNGGFENNGEVMKVGLKWGGFLRMGGGS
uniref:Polysaccharide biosynthesis domain-containing protein n=1 Tax=Coturnix japonica TaxID=93934 RepID=A0A8C2YDH7_COTJA